MTGAFSFERRFGNACGVTAFRGVGVAGAMLLALLIAPTAAAAQGACDQVNQSANVAMNDAGLPTQTAIITNGKLVCPGGKSVEAQQIGTSNATGVYTLYGNVRYSDGEKILTADNGQWMSRQGLLQARGNVIITDIKTGSRIYAPSLDYYQVSASNPVARMTTFGGRGRVIMKQARAAGVPASTPRDSSIVDADIIELIGERLFRGSGSATFRRKDLDGAASIVEYNQDRGTLLLAQNASVNGERYTLTADTINASGTEGQDLREVSASRNARLVTDEVRVETPFLRIFLDSGEVNRLVATRPAARPGEAPVALPRVMSSAFNVSADSIDALAPKQQLQAVHAIGNAFGERLDTVPPPDAAREMPEVLTHDWLRGDTLRASFIENPEAVPDSAGRREPMLDRIDAVGAGDGRQASSALRMRDPENASAWRIYYTLADRITVAFAKGAVLNVDLTGSARGIFLSPVGASTTVGTRTGGS